MSKLTLTVDMTEVESNTSEKFPGYVFLNPVSNKFGKIKAVGSDGRVYNLKLSIPPPPKAPTAVAKAKAEGTAAVDSLSAKVDTLTTQFAQLMAALQPKAAKAK